MSEVANGLIYGSTHNNASDHTTTIDHISISGGLSVSDVSEGDGQLYWDPDNGAINIGTTSHDTMPSNFYGYHTYTPSNWNWDAINVITHNEDGSINVHEKLVQAIVEKLLEDEKMTEMLLNALMEKIIKKNPQKSKINTEELNKVFS
jgi:hypothetical protein